MLRELIYFTVLAVLINSCGGAEPNSNSSTVANSLEKVVEVATRSQTVNISSPDGVIIVGTFYDAEKPNSPALLLLHQWESDRHSWDDLAKRLQRDGINVLAIDGRGFGDSTKRSDGSRVTAERSGAAVSAMIGDVGAAFEFLSKQKNVDPNRVGIIGASYGSSLALIYAAKNLKVATVALLSPGLNYFGNMETVPAIAEYGDRPSFMAAAEDDPESDKAVIQLAQASGEPRRAVVISVPKGGHGTALLKLDDVRKPLEDFCRERLGQQDQK